ncbi:MAG: beta-eliminating lyase-related protein [Candidatus Micrarchaeota archaeon]|nr:beta-eliminating lyase-related protein [Candidatus Micrarchaeota archaeon]
MLAPYREAAMARASEKMSAREMQTIRAELSRSRPLLEKQFGRADPEARKMLELGYTNRPIGKDSIAVWAQNHANEMPSHVIAARFNPFNVQAEMVLIDALSDSGSTTLSARQEQMKRAWKEHVSSIKTVAYAGLEPFAQLKFTVKELLGEQFDFYPTLQGRAAETLLFTAFRKLKITNREDMIVSNRPFDTTKGHIEDKGMRVRACTPMSNPEKYRNAESVFMGNINLDAVKARLGRPNKIKSILITVTDNGGGGQPVSMENVKKAAEIAREHGLILHIDACRISENALFVKLFEPGYENKTLDEIVKEMLSYADVVTVSFKKMYAHSGGAIFVNKEKVFRGAESAAVPAAELGKLIQKLTTVNYGCGFDSYAGLTGGGMIEIVSGLYEMIDPYRIASRILQISDVFDSLTRKYDFPVVGGAHALYVDSGAVLPGVKPELAAAEYLGAMTMAGIGTRPCGLGHKLYAKWKQNPDGEWVFKTPPTEMDSLRFAIPRETYSTELLNVVLGSVGEAYKSGVFASLSGGMNAIGFNTSGFYHFEGKYELVKPNEFRTAVAELSKFLPR